jgi:hypothetical protein
MIMLTKTNELTDAPLDWAVALAQGATNLKHDTVASWWFVLEGKDRTLSKGWSASQSYNPSTNWDQGGPIIEREGICLKKGHSGWWIAKLLDVNDEEHFVTVAPTPLVAAMRCYVISKLGNEVDIPKELL